jgi:glycosyltransferase involved in cell wall biosynthesis
LSGVSVIIPLRNGARFICDALRSVWAQDHEPLEIIVVDDGSTDGGLELAVECAGERTITVLPGSGRGAAAALNQALRQSRYPLVCQIDQDVVLERGWITEVIRQFDSDEVGAVQGVYVTDTHARLLSRVMGRDLEERYAAIQSDTDHVCTGNVAYRLDALRRIGFFDESLGYGYDNDVSYRLRAAGYRLIICSRARSLHRWRDSLAGYFRQQYGFGYGRLDLVAKYPHRVGGDTVSPTLMMLHPVVLLAALLTLGAGVLRDDGRVLWMLGLSLIAALAMERTIAGIRAARRFRDLTPLWFPLVHFVRDLAWVFAIVVWTSRRVLGTAAAPAHSMKERSATTADLKVRTTLDTTGQEVVRTFRSAGGPRALIVIPAFNEAANLPLVIAEIQSAIPDADILVVDDGSTDDTEEVVNQLKVRWIKLPERMGIGTAMRVGLRYAVRQRFPVVARLDGDGQHKPEDVRRLIELVSAGRADIAFGSRSIRRHGAADATTGVLKRSLAACLSLLTRRRVRDATCGLSAMGPRAVRLLAESHPTGYPEPELRLLISRTTLTAVDVDIDGRPRLSGRTSLTPLRMLRAAARVALAMYVVPLRGDETEPARD